MEYEVIKELKQREKSTVQLVRGNDKGQIFVQKIMKGQHPLYLTLQNCKHPFLPKLYDVSISESSTTVIEEYIDGQSLGSVELSEKQLLTVLKELCSVLEYLHGKNIIHRDIKPSNIILAKDGHIHLIDFDAARMFKDDLEQDTKSLGTRGYAPPEQYGFAQTDARADIYAVGITMKQLLGEKAGKACYRRIIGKCTDLNPDRRYISASQVKRALIFGRYSVFYGTAAVVLLLMILLTMASRQSVGENGATRQPSDENGVPRQSANANDVPPAGAELIVLTAPDNPHWDGETGIALWGNVPESGTEEDEVIYHWKLYRSDTEVFPNPDESVCEVEYDMRGHRTVRESEGSLYREKTKHTDSLCRYIRHARMSIRQ
ncbi:MAG: serine/threonine protein kinase [Bacillus sp. (in: Bacteria)]|nr:serine/threonine protein kinase [Bacillus sp. (in: firmicutes)]MCM1426065.1 serine/threonine protein kinase [Eubacterium sp.]